MPALTLTCLSPQVKALIQKELHLISDEATRKVFTEIVKVVASCPAGQQVGVELLESGRGGRARREKRAPSEYNTFTGNCMRQGKSMKECAVAWRRQKKS